MNNTMTPDQLHRIRLAPGIDRMIGPVPGADRTLLYGYDIDRRTWHVYQKDGEIRRLIYTSIPKDDILSWGETLDATTLVPNKRLYPEACDFIFCLELRRLEIPMTFTTFGGTRVDPDRQFHGRII